MIHYAIYDADGVIIQTGKTGRMATAEATAARLGGSLFIGMVNAVTMRIVDGVPVPR